MFDVIKERPTLSAAANRMAEVMKMTKLDIKKLKEAAEK